MGRLHCKRCSKEVHPGRGDYYLVRIEAVADPQPPVITQEDLDQGVIRFRFVFSGVIRFRFISSGKNDELTPDFPPAGCSRKIDRRIGLGPPDAGLGPR